MSTRSYLVPHDFSPVGNAATQQALFIAKQTRSHVQLLHITKSDRDIPAAQKKLDEYIKSLNLGPSDPQVTGHIKKGSIFEDIHRMAEELNSNLIVMGTHGAKGMQKVFGSHAMKVITSSGLPFLVVQEGPAIKKIEKIIVPIDLSKESLQIINYAADLAVIFDSEIHVVGEDQADARLSHQIANRVILVKKQFAERKVNSKVELLKGSGSFSGKVIQYCKEVNGDMVAIAYHNERIIAALDKFAQSLLTNELGKPVLIVNSVEVSFGYF